MAAKRRFKGCSSDDLHIKKQARTNVDHDEKQNLNPDQIQKQAHLNLQIQKQENLSLDHIQTQENLDVNLADEQTHLDAFEVNKQEHLGANHVDAQIKSESLGLVKPTNFHQKLKDNLGRSEVIFSQYELLRRICSFLSTTDLFNASLGNYKSNSS